MVSEATCQWPYNCQVTASGHAVLACLRGAKLQRLDTCLESFLMGDDGSSLNSMTLLLLMVGIVVFVYRVSHGFSNIVTPLVIAGASGEGSLMREREEFSN